MSIQNYVLGQWVSGQGSEYEARHAITGASLGHVSSQGLNYDDILAYGREKGGVALRAMTFPQRGLMLKALAMHLQERKEAYYAVSAATGATRVDSWIDIEGGIGNLFTNASLRREFADQSFHIDGPPVKLSKNGTFLGQHIMVPKRGVAVHINAFNFPVWGMLEKIAVNLLAGVPAVVKPSEFTSFLTEVVVKDIIASGILPEGSLQLVSGKGHGILDAVQRGDTVTFTGSATTGMRLKEQPHYLERGVAFNLEADSLNAMVLGEDARPGTPEFDIFIKEVAKEITIKAGHKCTAVRRVVVPAALVEDVQSALAGRLATTAYGDPSVEGVRMGSLATQLQVERVRSSVEALAQENEVVFGRVDGMGEAKAAHPEAGAFYAPVLLRNEQPLQNLSCHSIEAFGPVSTIMPYHSLAEAAEIVALGRGSLVTSFVSADRDAAREFALEAAYSNGRIHLLDASSAKESTGHGSPMPLLTHGGPGRAGDGEEMGGMRGVMHYLQRVALQGHPNTLTAVTGRFTPGADRPEAEPHLFRQHFEDLRIGDTVTTAKHLVTLQDIEDFAELSGDKFYAHMDENSLEGTIFTGRVAHGYFILSRAAGLFVDPPKGPVLLNYGLESCRFTKPVYPGTEIGVQLTVQEKIDQEKRSPEDIAKGIVKYYVEVTDDTQEVVAVATILTMVKKRNQA
ncbi:MAG TPA: phenylacetic acid degradation bifunctional protein PaaZ [Cryomorphaceae bacterium]|nr:phenylacetic acid degradation bifunctional protein PaaZ [Cryomorphaceae bacterium]